MKIFAIMKKIALALLLMLGLFGVIIYYFSDHIDYLLSDTSVAGCNYTTFTFKEYSWGNGFSMWNLGTTYRLNKGDNVAVPPWVDCADLVLPLKRMLANYSKTWNDSKGSMKVIIESNENGYNAYILKNKELFFVSGYPDFGGTPPSEEEKKVCAE
ncbi:hypothetical protein MNBD_GAMMA24-807 [hydrothermal vent metagenome]|uniref:Uncharacterized protein n=1 Tax=hydrothermal vent metagenome TaxID=652676 RepID=A0A3B1C7B8_9ZZZZ